MQGRTLPPLPCVHRQSQARRRAPCRAAGGDSSAWEACARALWANAGAAAHGAEIETVLGASGHLTGKGSAGSGVLVSLALRRALPGSLPPPH
jgi:hypothetical protein